MLLAGTHGRGALRLNDSSAAVPAFVLSKVDAGKPIGPNSQVTYTLTLRNIGNADATGVTITDPIPANTSYVARFGVERRLARKWRGQVDGSLGPEGRCRRVSRA